MKTTFDHCKECDCGQKRPIESKTHYLCKEKNHIRKHGKTLQQTAIDRANKYKDKAKAKHREKSKRNTTPKGKKNKPIRSRDKTIEIEARYRISISQIANEREPFCTGCGKYQGGNIRLSHSHIVSRADCRALGRLDLISDKENITYHCLDFGEHEGCHRKWEGARKNELLDFEQNMEYVRSISEELYQRKLHKVAGEIK